MCVTLQSAMKEPAVQVRLPRKKRARPGVRVDVDAIFDFILFEAGLMGTMGGDGEILDCRWMEAVFSLK